jgi:nucleoid-associated protein EbfC
MKNLGQMMKQAQEMQTRMQQMQDALAEVEVTGQSGAGMVNVTLNGKGEMKRLKLDKSVVDPEDV